MLALDSVEQGPVVKGDGVVDVAAGLLDRLLDGSRDFAGLAVAEADAAIAVADDSQSGEREDAAALDDLGDAVDRDQLFLQFACLGFFFIALHLVHS